MERSQVFQNALLSPEVTPGTWVNPTKRLQSTYITATPDAPVRMMRPGGMRYDVEATYEKEMTNFSYEGALSYTDIVYILHSLLGVPTGTGTWTWKPAAFTSDVIKAFSIATGNSQAAEGFSYGLFNSLRARFSKTDASVSGDGFGQALKESPTLGTIVNVAKKPVSPKQLSVWMGDSVGTLTRLTRCLEVEWVIRGMLGQLFTLNDQDESFSDVVALAPELGFNVTLAHDSASKALMNSLRTNELKFFRLLCTGAEIDEDSAYSIQVTAPVKIRDPRPGENQGVVGRTYNLACQHDDTFGGAIEVVVSNEMSAL